MLPTTTDNGARLAAILPSGLAAMARGAGYAAPEELRIAPDVTLPAIRSFVMIVVDGLGSANLSAAVDHAPTLGRLQRKRIETVAPSTTGAALTSLVTGALPGEHGLIGYRIRHPELGLITTLRDWDGIADRAAWQRMRPLFHLAGDIGARAFTIGRPAHASGGLTEAILAGAEYVGGQRIKDRFSAASQLLRGGEPAVVYLYVDELDKAAHESGWQSEAWLYRLEQLDGALDSLLRGLPGDVGVVVTADHGMVDVAAHQQIVIGSDSPLLSGVDDIGGEPRFRALYLSDGADAEEVAQRWQDAEGGRAWIFTREEAMRSGAFGNIAPEVAPRLGDVMVSARKQVAYYSHLDDPRSLSMVGQHGSFTDEERGVPLALAGALAGTGFANAVAAVARARSRA